MFNNKITIIRHGNKFNLILQYTVLKVYYGKIKYMQDTINYYRLIYKHHVGIIILLKRRWIVIQNV